MSKQSKRSPFEACPRRILAGRGRGMIKGENKMRIIGISNIFSMPSMPIPAIRFDNLTYDFGVVKQGVTLEHIFKFTNEGDGQLIINSVQPSCGCTGVIMDGKKEFKKGEEGEIKITFSAEGRQGVNTKSVIVNTNDLANPVIILTFKCEIEGK